MSPGGTANSAIGDQALSTIFARRRAGLRPRARPRWRASDWKLLPSDWRPSRRSGSPVTRALEAAAAALRVLAAPAALPDKRIFSEPWWRRWRSAGTTGGGRFRCGCGGRCSARAGSRGRSDRRGKRVDLGRCAPRGNPGSAWSALLYPGLTGPTNYGSGSGGGGGGAITLSGQAGGLYGGGGRRLREYRAAGAGKPGLIIFIHNVSASTPVTIYGSGIGCDRGPCRSGGLRLKSGLASTR